MIIIGFPGIGKSSVTRAYDGETNTTGYIDLESSNFIKDDNWVKEYCDLAINLELQGYNVFVSSHREVREYFTERQGIFQDVVEVFPAMYLYYEWMSRLLYRYSTNPSDKNYRAYNYIKNNFYTAIEEMEQDKIVDKIRITKENMNDLEKAMADYWNEHRSE